MIEEKKNRMVSIMNMHAVECLLTIFGGGKVIPSRLTGLLQGVRGLRLMIPRKHQSRNGVQRHITNYIQPMIPPVSRYRLVIKDLSSESINSSQNARILVLYSQQSKNSAISPGVLS